MVRCPLSKPADSMPAGSPLASFLLSRAIASLGYYKSIGVYEDFVYGGERPPTWGGVSVRVRDTRELPFQANEYAAIYLSNDATLSMPYGLRPLDDWVPMIADIQTTHLVSQWSNLFQAALTGYLRCTDGFVFRSGRTRNLFEAVWHDQGERFGKMSFPRSIVIPNGIDASENRRDSGLRELTRKALGLKPHQTVFLAFNRLVPTKKLDYGSLIVLWQEVVRRNSNAVLILSGSVVTDPNYQAYPLVLRSLARQAHVSNNVIVIEDPFEVWEQARTNLMSAADVFIHTTKGIEEASPLVVLEALSHGLPAIVSDWSGLSEIVDHGKTGFLIPTWCSHVPHQLTQTFGGRDSSAFNGNVENYVGCDAEQLVRRVLLMAETPELRKRMGEAARLKIENVLTIEKVARDHIAFFRELSASAEREWDSADHPKPKPLVNMNSVACSLASRHLEPNSRISKALGANVEWLPDTTDRLFNAVSAMVLGILDSEGTATASKVTELVSSQLQNVIGDSNRQELDEYCMMALIRMMSYGIIHFEEGDLPHPW